VLSAQNFEGKINYKTTFKSKLPNMSDEQFALMLGSKQEYDIKDGNYKITTNGTFLKWQTFINKENKIYTKMGNSGSLFWKDAAENSDEIISSEIKKIVTTILGHPCDELTIISKKSIEKYYFGNILKTDPALFVNHKLGHFDEVIRKANAMPLKMVISNEQFEMESVAIEILPIQFNEAMCALPAGVKTEKSQF
ncbi:MAG: hypothetical protein ABIS36_06500, partial [Chryseolinea sp.]